MRRKGFAEVKSKITLRKWKNDVDRGIPKAEMIKQINEHVYQKFVAARETFKILRSSHLRSFAMQKYAEISNPKPNFMASSMWLKTLKRKYKIASRKINRLVSKREVKSEEEIMEAASNFQKEIQTLAPNFDPTHIFNTDQSGFSYEITSERTLTRRGKKIVFG